MITKQADVLWNGDGKTGKGAISTQSGVLKDAPYGFTARFEGGPGTNPEELIGAAHAGCFSMALAFALAEAGFKATEIKTNAKVSMDKEGSGFAIKDVKLTLSAKIPEIDDKKFQEIASGAKANCPVSKALKVPISLTATLN
ncbi:MAG: OsmC family peroxiredoxin [Proteobacteria bacterium]|jgi:osmotically inducible protein OsmC|nr:MAG: OsmC family peroxiredoxin [Pseudomonadota bacterium]RYZ55631.1 MAG: OsmC family peroxiredoxin [Pseudomonadota bacterium]